MFKNLKNNLRVALFLFPNFCSSYVSDLKITGDQATQEPLSRFWGCFFSCSIFALLWTNKMSKTRKWIPLFAVFVTVWFVLDYILYPPPVIDEDMAITEIVGYSLYVEPHHHLEAFLSGLMYEYFPHSGDLDDVIFLISFSLIVLYHTVIFIGSIFVVVYFMFKWTTQYNLKTCGYKSKREWKKATQPQRNITEKLKQYSSQTASSVIDIGKKTGERIPADKIKTKSADVAEKIKETAANLKSTQMSDDDKRTQIREWHDMMIMGVITESDFEKKKAELMDSQSK